MEDDEDVYGAKKVSRQDFDQSSQEDEEYGEDELSEGSESEGEEELTTKQMLANEEERQEEKEIDNILDNLQ